MNFIQHKILTGQDAIFMGDFNFDYSWQNEKAHIDWDNYIDMWRYLKDQNEESFTMNGTSNFKPVVLDHIILNKTCNFEPDFIQRVGNFCCRNFNSDLINDIREDDVVRTPSDHLGLYAIIKKSSF